AYLRNALLRPDGAAHKSPNIYNILKSMQASLNRIKNQRKAIENTISYAAVAAKSHASKSAKGQAMPENILKEKKRAKEITIRVEDPKKAKKLRKKTLKDILLTAQATGAEVTGVQRLSSGNVRFHARLQYTKDIFQNNTT
ncbi:hypothetical protein MMC22_008104, partial [Lobaria immixta]|nr:hypothetical protein [Lobaria immixta]